MKYGNYSSLVEYLKSLNNQKLQINAIWEYFFDNVEMDYVMIEHLNKILTTRFTDYTHRKFGNASLEAREKCIRFITNSSNISNEYCERIKNKFFTPKLNVNGKQEYITLTEALNNITTDVVIENGLLKKGIAEDFAKFAQQICIDIGIKSVIVKGISSGDINHTWLDIEIGGKELFYDITYAIYIRDNFNGMRNRFKIDEWLGITPKKLYKNQPTRTIEYPEKLDLQYLWENDLTVKLMK